MDSYNINSEKFSFKPSEIDYVFVCHTHVDHIGLLPRLVKEGFNGKIIASHATAQLIKPLLYNCVFILESEANTLSFKYKRNYSPIYTEEDVKNTLNLIYEYDDIHKLFVLDDIVSFQWLENSHCVGSRQLQLILKDNNGVSQSILYTSDIGSLNTKNHYLKNTEIPRNFNRITIMESTYGEPGRINKKTRKFDLEKMKTAIETVIDIINVYEFEDAATEAVVSEIAATPSMISLKANAKQQLSIIGIREGLYSNVDIDPSKCKYESDNQSYAKANASGEISAVAQGTANITVTYGTCKDIVQVKVTA